MLGLKLPTDPRWVNLVERSIEEILTDHAYCEQKATSTAISLIINFSDREKLVEVLTPAVSEEWGHFQRVIKELKKRNLKLGRPRKDEYVNELFKLERKGGNIEIQLMDRLLINALVEARSCERFRLLSLEINDLDLRKFYHELMISEAGHYRNYIGLAKEYMDANIVDARWQEILNIEIDILAKIELRGDKVH